MLFRKCFVWPVLLPLWKANHKANSAIVYLFVCCVWCTQKMCKQQLWEPVRKLHWCPVSLKQFLRNKPVFEQKLSSNHSVLFSIMGLLLCGICGYVGSYSILIGLFYQFKCFIKESSLVYDKIFIQSYEKVTEFDDPSSAFDTKTFYISNKDQCCPNYKLLHSK